MKRQEHNKTPGCCIDDGPDAYSSPLSNILRSWSITIVAKMDEEDGELDGNGMLWDMGVVVKDIIIFDELHEAIEDNWGDV